MRSMLDAHLEGTGDPFRELHNGLLMPENEYEPAMRRAWKRGAHDPITGRQGAPAAAHNGGGSPHAEALPPEPLWIEGVPGWEKVKDEESVAYRDVDLNDLGLNRAISHVSRPAAIPYLPPRQRATGQAVVVLPGGGFTHLAIDKEGYDVALWLRSLGIAAIVVKYRTARDDRASAIRAAEEDVRRAIRLVRSRAEEWQIDPDQIGVLGFSAGGYLVARAAAEWDAGQPDAADPVERTSCKPDFLGLLYPAIPEGAEDQVSAETGPAFIAQANDDFLDPAQHSLRYYAGLRRAEVPVEMHLYPEGGHGFGLGIHGGAAASWPEQYAAWLKSTAS
jgi:endo-1,4-beta-xylanase